MRFFAVRGAERCEVAPPLQCQSKVHFTMGKVMLYLLPGAVSNHWKRTLFILTITCGILACLPNSAFAARTISLAWDPSPDPTVIGYNVYYGTVSGNYTNIVSAGNSSTASVTGLIEGQTYYFAVTAYDAAGLESVFSNEVSYRVPSAVLAVQQKPSANGGATSIVVTSQNGSPSQWTLESSRDLKNWSTVARGTNIPVNVTLNVSNTPARFFRLKNQ